MGALADAHLHFWEPASRHHDWLHGNPALQRRFGPEDLDAGRHKVLAAVFVQADARDEEPLDEVKWVTGLSAVATYRLEGPPLETLGSSDARGALRR